MRLLMCNSCKTIETLPDYDGPAEHDNTLTHALTFHRTPTGEPHRGGMANVEDKDWNDPRKQGEIISKLSESNSTGFESSFYVTKANSMEDAMKCWAKHLRPVDSCPDYMSDSKRMSPDTAADRKELGLGARKTDPAKDVHLCHFCPIHVKVLERRKAAAGLYKK